MSYDVRELILRGRADWSPKVLTVLISVAFPIIEGILINLNTQTREASPGEAADVLRFLLFLVIGIHLASVLVLLFRGAQTPNDALAALVQCERDYKELQEQGGAVKGQRDIYFVSQDCFMLALAVLNDILQKRPLNRTPQEREADFKLLLQPFVAQREALFNFHTRGALFNLAIYLVDPDRRRLSPVYRDSDPELERTGPLGRSWEVGCGHIGICYAQDKVILTPDLHRSRELFTLNSKQDHQYRTSASVPIRDGNEVRGVLTITSSEPDQMPERVFGIIVESIGNLLSVYLTSTQDCDESRTATPTSIP